VIIEYSHGATPEYLNTLGVDPTRLPAAARFRGELRYFRALADENRSLAAGQRGDGTASTRTMASCARHSGSHSGCRDSRIGL